MRKHLQGAAAVAAGFPVDADRYDQSLCEKDPQASELAARLERYHFHNPPDWVKGAIKQVVSHLYRRIEQEGIAIYECEGEPYRTSEDMYRDVAENQRMFVRHRRLGPVTGALTQEWRAVHDYYGHVKQRAPFTLRGELAAFTKHTTQFPRVCWPFIWNNVVLENAFRLNRGHFLCFNEQCSSKIVFDEEFFEAAPSAYYDEFLQAM